MSILFEPMKIRNMALRNRFVRSATSDRCANKDGHVTEKQVKLFAELAKGGVGLIVTGITYVHYSGQLSPFQGSIATDDCIPGLKRLTAIVHDSGAKIAVQLFHAGREAAGFFKAKKGRCAIAPSFVLDDPYFIEEYRPMSEDQIWATISAFGDAARRAREAEFDAIQIHAAHAYLLSQFLSPYTNRRCDDWGGSLDRRLRFHREIYRVIRDKVGEDFPLLIKIGVQDGFKGGLESREGKLAAQLLAQCGFDALEISQGLRGETYEGTEFRSKIDCMEREGYFRAWSKEIKREVDIPVMMVGGLRSFELMEEVIRKREADFISLSRPLIKEPGTINKWKSGDHSKSTCMSCNQCLEALKNGERLHCVQQERGKKG